MKQLLIGVLTTFLTVNGCLATGCLRTKGEIVHSMGQHALACADHAVQWGVEGAMFIVDIGELAIVLGVDAANVPVGWLDDLIGMMPPTPVDEPSAPAETPGTTT